MNNISENSIEILKVIVKNKEIENWKKRNFFKSQIDILESYQKEFVKWVKYFIDNHKSWLVKSIYTEGFENYFESEFEECLDKLEERYFKDIIDYALILVKQTNELNIPISILLLESVRFGYKEPTKEDLKRQNSRYFNPEIKKVFEIHFPNKYQGNIDPNYERMLYCDFEIEEIEVLHKFGGTIQNLEERGIHRIITINPIPRELNIQSINKLTIGFNFDKAFWIPIIIEKPYFIKHDKNGEPIEEITNIPKEQIEFYKENPLIECQVIIKETPKKYIHHPNSKNEWRIGGMPNWVQEQEEVNCPECNGKMKFIIQLPSGYLKDNKGEGVFYGSDGGTTYGFWCDKDQIMGYIWQDT